MRSTNTALLDRARAGADAASAATRAEAPALVHRSVESAAFGRRAIDAQPVLLVAEHQSAGRGRQGRTWQSEAGASLTFSLALPIAAGVDCAGLSLAVGVALADALDDEPAHRSAAGDTAAAGTATMRIGLKWPNDLWLLDAGGAGRKLGGVLIETLTAGSQRLVVIGIGLNVRPFERTAPSTGFAGLSELHPEATAPAVLRRIALPLVTALRAFERDGFGAFAARFHARDVLLGLQVTTTLPAAALGVARGVSEHGALQVEVDGQVVPVASGEVSVRLAAPEPGCAP